MVLGKIEKRVTAKQREFWLSILDQELDLDLTNPPKVKRECKYFANNYNCFEKKTQISVIAYLKKLLTKLLLFSFCQLYLYFLVVSTEIGERHKN